jgi:CRP/FNR family cyclic AMP-dependent transcriptional regulator
MARSKKTTATPSTSGALTGEGKLIFGIDALGQKGTLYRYKARTVLIQEGEKGDTMFIIISGRLRAFSADNRGREVTLGTYGPGDYVGEMALDGGPRSASVKALEATVCAVVTAEMVRMHIAAYPEFAHELISRLIRRARLATASLRSVALIDTYGRLANLLNGLAKPQPDGTYILFERITHLDIANQIACSREMVSRLMKDLEKSGYLSIVDRHVRLLKPIPIHW